jgi:methyl-accepting chemotaxis protein
MSPRLILALGVMAAMIALLTAWAARRLTSPLTLLADAAERLGRDVTARPLAVSGSRELRSAAQAFNEMQTSLKRLIENRTQMLGATARQKSQVDRWRDRPYRQSDSIAPTAIAIIAMPVTACIARPPLSNFER